MPVYQTNVFICEICEKIETFTIEESMYSDPVIVSPNDTWKYDKNSKSYKLCCPNCVEKYKIKYD